MCYKRVEMFDVKNLLRGDNYENVRYNRNLYKRHAK